MPRERESIMTRAYRDIDTERYKDKRMTYKQIQKDLHREQDRKRKRHRKKDKKNDFIKKEV